ncbi:hypothetical protein ACF0H5_020566 [Mactra antiquata]
MMEHALEGSDDEDDNVLSLLDNLPADVLVEIFTFLDWNDLYQVACTCTKFWHICKASSIWLRIRCLDFRNCAIPLPDKILQVLNRTPNASHIILGQVITEDKVVSEPTSYNDDGNDDDDDDDMDTGETENKKDNLQSSDRFVLNVLKCCTKISHLELYMGDITDMSVNAVCAKCTVLESLKVSDNCYINKRAIRELVSLNSTLKQLDLEWCDSLGNIRLTHIEPSRHLTLQKFSISGIEFDLNSVTTLFTSCPQLMSLKLAGCMNLYQLALNTSNTGQNARAGFESLQELVVTSCNGLTEINVLPCLNLKYLHISDCTVLQKIIVNSPTLCQLMIDCTSIDNNVKQISMNKSSIESLSCKNMSSLELLDIGSDVLKELDLQSCSKLSVDQLLSSIANKEYLTSLNICGCKNISPTDLNDVILPQLTALQILQYGGHSWNTVDLKSSCIKHLHFSDCINTTCILLNMPQLESLTLNKCRDFSEMELMDSLLYGKLITRMQGLESLVTENRESPFTQDSGTSRLSSIKFENLPGLHGDIISHSLHHFRYLRTVEFIRCSFLCNLSVMSWPSLTELRIQSCNALRNLTVEKVPTLQTMSVKWCCMLQTCTIQAENVTSLDMLGTNFVQLSVNSNRLKTLHLNGVCTQPQHSIQLRCSDLTDLSITKCDRLTDDVLNDIFIYNPSLKSINLIGSLSLKSIFLPESIEECSLTGHRLLKELKTLSPPRVKHLTLNNLPKFVPSDRLSFLCNCEQFLRVLEVRAIPGETTLNLQLKELLSLTLDQGIHLASLEIRCPKLKYLRIKGCPKLSCLTLHVDSLTRVQVYHSTPLLALRQLTVYSKHVVHLARVLAYYTPKLQELSLHGSEVKGSEIYRLGTYVPNLQTVILSQCDVSELEYQGPSLEIDSVTISRQNDLPLSVRFMT